MTQGESTCKNEMTNSLTMFSLTTITSHLLKMGFSTLLFSGAPTCLTGCLMERQGEAGRLRSRHPVPRELGQCPGWATKASGSSCLTLDLRSKRPKVIHHVVSVWLIQSASSRLGFLSGKKRLWVFGASPHHWPTFQRHKRPWPTSAQASRSSGLTVLEFGAKCGHCASQSCGAVGAH